MREANYQGLWNGMTLGARDAFQRLSSAKGEHIPASSIHARTFLALARRGVAAHGGGYVYLTDIGRKLKAHLRSKRRAWRQAVRKGRVKA